VAGRPARGPLDGHHASGSGDGHRAGPHRVPAGVQLRPPHPRADAARLERPVHRLAVVLRHAPHGHARRAPRLLLARLARARPGRPARAARPIVRGRPESAPRLAARRDRHPGGDHRRALQRLHRDPRPAGGPRRAAARHRRRDHVAGRSVGPPDARHGRPVVSGRVRDRRRAGGCAPARGEPLGHLDLGRAVRGPHPGGGGTVQLPHGRAGHRGRRPVRGPKAADRRGRGGRRDDAARGRLRRRGDLGPDRDLGPPPLPPLELAVGVRRLPGRRRDRRGRRAAAGADRHARDVARSSSGSGRSGISSPGDRSGRSRSSPRSCASAASGRRRRP